jgi:N-acetylglucosamine kinase-like BadF-type ATPase
MGALRSGAALWEGVVVAVGTHNAVGARRRDGRMFHLGFWPDLAGGFELGSQALKATYRAAFGLGPATALEARVLETFGEADAMALLHAFTRREKRLPSGEARKLAGLVLDVADAGDVVAIGIVERMGATLGDQGRVSAEKVELPLEGATVVLTGGVMQHPSTRLAAAIMARMPGARAVRPEAPPIAGALLIAFDELGVAAKAEELTAGLVLAEGR